MLEQKKAVFRYRDYIREPLSEDEIRAVLAKAGLEPRDVLRKNDKANRVLGLAGSEAPDVLIRAMAEHPTLLQRPLVVLGDVAVLGRPVENLLPLIEAGLRLSS